MQNQPSIGLALIARDEAHQLPALLASIEGAFNRVVLLDTGSKDATVEVFQTWARAQAGLTFSVAHYEWHDDFADARNAADELLLFGRVDGHGTPMVDFTCWADCDDVIDGARNLRAVAANMPDSALAAMFDYDYAQHPETGACICVLRRERLVRAGASRWEGRVHEAQPIRGGVVQVSPDTAIWRHRKNHATATVTSGTRNLRILRAWLKDEPENPRVLAYVGTETASQGKPKQAVGFYRRYLKLKTGWDEERAQVHRKLSCALIALGRFDEAQESALTAIGVMPEWPDSYLTLAECAIARDEFKKAEVNARRALELGTPKTMLIVNPLDYTCHPHRLLAGALGGQGRFDEAIEHAGIAMSLDPGDMSLRYHAGRFHEQAKREHTVNTYILAAQQLVAHDEQIKALILLEDCVPHFATDDPRVVEARSHIRERLGWMRTPEAFADHYEHGGSKPEDFIADEQIEPLCRALPRVGFLLDGLHDQRAKAA